MQSGVNGDRAARLWRVAGGLAVLAAGLALWAGGGLAEMARWAAAAQHEAQQALAGAVRALRAGAPGAVWGLMAVAFGYGLAHAAGPGHGKVLVGSYGVARRVPVMRLAGLALVASLAQAAVAVALVYATLAALGWSRDRVLGAAEGVLAPLGQVMIAGLGAWLVWRGGRGLWRGRGRKIVPDHGDAGHVAGHSHGHDHGHTRGHSLGHDHRHHHVHDENCGHAHGPTLAEVQALTGWRDGLALVAGIAIRPCSGALLLLVLTWQLGVGGYGVLATFAMGLGTACVTVGAAMLAVWAREGVFAALPGQGLVRLLPLVELGAGALIIALAIWQMGGAA